MTDKTKKKEQANLDLRTAEQKLIEAGQPELAGAMSFYTNGIRNLIQEGIAEPFIEAVQNIVAPIKDEIERQGEIRRTQFNELREHGDARQEAIIAELQGVSVALGKAQTDIADLGERVGALETLIEQRPAQRKLEQQALLEAFRDRLEIDEERLDKKRKELDAIHEWQASIDRRLAELEKRRIAAERNGDGG